VIVNYTMPHDQGFKKVIFKILVINFFPSFGIDVSSFEGHQYSARFSVARHVEHYHLISSLRQLVYLGNSARDVFSH
jgi:hypothetical protein